MAEGAVADGICLDEAGGVWVASPTSNDRIRIEEGGNVRIASNWIRVALPACSAMKTERSSSS
jgi:hypothetical protein